MKTKICTVCGLEKTLLQFSKSKKGKHGKKSKCKECTAREDKIYSRTEAGKKSGRNRAREYYWRNRERIVKKAAEYIRDNKDKVRANKKESIKKASLSLTDGFIKQRLNDRGIKAKEVTPQMIAIKREALQLTRLVREFKNGKWNPSDGNNRVEGDTEEISGR